ncbi:MAG: sensor histidine kinase [Suipraeoptans sp.]
MRRWLNRQNFGKKLFYINLVIILIPIIALSIFEFLYTSQVLDRKTNEYLRNLAEVTLTKIDATIANIENVAFYINGDDVIQKSLQEALHTEEDMLKDYALYQQVRREISSFVMLNQEINSVDILSEKGQIYNYTKQYYDTSINLRDYIKDEDQYWIVDEKHIFYMKKMCAYPSQELLGYMALDVKGNVLFDLISDIDLTGNGQVFLVNETGEIITAGDSTLMGQKLEQEYMECLSNEESFSEAVKVGDMHYNIYNSRATANGWHIILTLPREDYIRDISNLRNMVIIVTAIIVLIALLVSRIVAKKSTQSITNLSVAMEEFGQGNFEVNFLVESEDEIGRLSQTFNKMVADMNELVNTVYEQKMLKQKAQMESLQMQINPHFLYNTLDTINWMARIKEADDIGDMISALGNLMRYSLAKESNVKIRDEIRNLEDYLFIQSYRYGDKLSHQILIDDSLLDILVPRLLIQPILENAIVHGIEEKLDAGNITIRFWAVEQDLYIQIEDDGVGMTEKDIIQILNEDVESKKSNHTSIGVVNVNKRIQMSYGSEYGLAIQSSLGAGTKMTIHITTLLKTIEYQ